MDFEIRRVQPGDEHLALKVVYNLKPEDERDGHKPSIHHLSSFFTHDANYLIIALVDSGPVGF